MSVKIEFEPEPHQRQADRMPQWLPGEAGGAVALIEIQQSHARWTRSMSRPIMRIPDATSPDEARSTAGGFA
jgi:hypothetical protein